MHIDWWTLALQTINLLVLVWILSRFLFRPIADIVSQRQAAADDLLHKAEAERVRAEEAESKAEAERQAMQKARGDVLLKAEQEAEASRAQLLEQARDETDKLRANAKAEVAKLREVQEASMGREASELAVQIAAKLFDRLPDAARIDGFIDGLAEAAAKLPERTRAEIGVGDETVAVAAARALSESERAACKAALAKALGRDVKIEVTVDPALIAGLEITAPHASVRNSFRADLDRIAAELGTHASA
ncbi:MAG: F0F1 ATP synthase subunit delta [Novosphingobium sp.]|nr:F0F1 ATP synthase subunit delta [Novosphingobium sp.]